MVVSRLHGHSSKTLVGLGRELLSNGDTISKQQLQQSLRNYHISLTVEVSPRKADLHSHCHYFTGYGYTLVVHCVQSETPILCSS